MIRMINRSTWQRGTILLCGMCIACLARSTQAELSPSSEPDRISAQSEELPSTGNHKLISSETRIGARLGVSVATSGDIILAGARGDSTKGIETGAALVFERQDGVWQNRALLVANDAAAWAHLGYAVAINGSTAIIGAFKDDQGGFESGAIYLLDLGPTPHYNLSIKYLAPDGSAGDRFGQSVAIDGATIVVGAPQAQGHGLVYVFERDDQGALSIRNTLSADDANQGDQFGHAVAISGHTIVVGASLADADGNGSGAAYVFECVDQADCTQRSRLVPDFEASDALFGKSVAIDGDTIVIGAPTFKDDTTETGLAVIFGLDATNQWVQRSILHPATNEVASLFGLTVDVRGDILAIGAPADNQAAINSGAAYIYRRNNVQDRRDEVQDWILDFKIAPLDAEPGDAFARSIALGEDFVAIGSVLDDPSGQASGSVYVYDLLQEKMTSPVYPDPAQDFDSIFRADHLAKWINYSIAPKHSKMASVSCPADEQPMRDVDPSFFNVSGKELSATFPGLETILEQLNEGHIHSIGSKIHWEYLEALQNQPTWADSDHLLSRFNTASLEPLLTIRGTPQWASSDPSAEQYWLFPPAEVETWHQFITDVVSRYGHQGLGLVKKWEIWNEPNSQHFFLGSTNEYVNMLNSAYSAVKEADPEALVYAPAVAFSPWNLTSAWAFVDDVISNGSFDVFSIHLYFSDIDNFYNTVITLRQKLDNAGMSEIPIAITEVNRIESVIDCSGFSALPDWLHAQQLQDIFACLANAGANSVYWFKSTDRGQSCGLPHDDLDLRNGLLDPLWYTKANYDALASLAYNSSAIFTGDFENGDTAAWSVTVQ